MPALVVIMLEVEDADFAAGWQSNSEELAGSVKATLQELIGDDDMAYTPSDVTVHVSYSPGI